MAVTAFRGIGYCASWTSHRNSCATLGSSIFLRDAAKLVFRALWPERAWLIARYGRYTFSTRLRHLFDAARGRI